MVGEHTIVTMQFVVKDDTGEVLDDMYGNTPIKFAYGRGDLPPGLERGIRGLRAGQEKVIVVSEEEGYGPRHRELIVRIHRSELPSGECRVGERYSRRNEDGEMEIYTVMGFLDDWVWLDRNHPWAGKALRYEIKILEVCPGGWERSRTAEPDPESQRR